MTEVRIQETEEKMKEPRRPLSAYNLFYRFKRSKLIEAHQRGASGRVDTERLLRAPPGLEDRGNDDAATTAPTTTTARRRAAIREALIGNLFPADTEGRAHRKRSHGVGLGFVDLNRVVCASWKAIDGDARAVFEELADDGRRLHKERVKKYREKYPPSPRDKQAKASKKRKSRGVVAAPGSEPLAKTLHVVEAPPSCKDSADATSRLSAAPAPWSAIPTPKPRHSLAAYHLFCRFKRAKILAARCSKDAALRLIAAPPGLEDHPAAPLAQRRADIRAVLRAEPRPCHVPGLSHAEVTGLVSESWRSIDEFARAVFLELAEAGAARGEPRPAPRKRASIRSCLERIAGHPPGAFDPIDVLPGGGGVDEVVSHPRAQYKLDTGLHKSEVSADDFMKLISILDDNLCG